VAMTRTAVLFPGRHLPSAGRGRLTRPLRGNGSRTVGSGAPPKTAKSARTVPLGQVVIDELAAHLAAYPSDGPLFTVATGARLRYVTWVSAWARACKAVSLDVDTHALRHFYASALIAGGASVKVVQTRLAGVSWLFD
jgi:integrase